jgi:hypothetical protein
MIWKRANWKPVVNITVTSVQLHSDTESAIFVWATWCKLHFGIHNNIVHDSQKSKWLLFQAQNWKDS